MINYFMLPQTQFLKVPYLGSIPKKHLLIFIFLLNGICFSSEAHELNASGASNVVTTVINWSNGNFIKVYPNPWNRLSL